MIFLGESQLLYNEFHVMSVYILINRVQRVSQINDPLSWKIEFLKYT